MSEQDAKRMSKKRFRFKNLYGKGKPPLPFRVETITSPVPRPETDLLEDWARFYLYKEVIGIESPNTVRGKLYDLHKLIAFFKFSKGQAALQVWDKALSSSFMQALEREYGVGTAYRVFATTTNFVNFLILHGAINPVDNPVREIKTPEQELPPAQGILVVTDGQVVPYRSKEVYNMLLDAAQSFIDKPRTDDKANRTLPFRDKAIVAVLYNTGLRAEKACSITIAQLDQVPTGGVWIREIKCKGNKYRSLYMKKEAWDVLSLCLDNERGWEPGFVFRSWRGNRLSQRDLWNILKRIADKACESLPPGTTMKIHPHSMRHERGFVLRNSKRDPGDATIAKQLGHSGTGQVARYSRRSEEDEAEMLEEI